MLHKCKKNKYRLLLFSLAVGEPICIHFTGCILVEKLKVPTSLHLIFIFIKSIQKPIYIQAIFTLGFSFTCSPFLFISIFSSPSFPLALSLSVFLSIFVYLSFLRSAFHVNPLGGVAEGGLMASLFGVLAAVLLQLLGGYTGSTAQASVAGGHSSSFAIFSSFF